MAGEKKNYFSSFEICLVSLQDSLFASGLGLSCPSHPPMNSGCCWIKSCYKMCTTFNQIQRNLNWRKARKFSGLRNAGFSPPYRFACLLIRNQDGPALHFVFVFLHLIGLPVFGSRMVQPSLAALLFFLLPYNGFLQTFT